MNRRIGYILISAVLALSGCNLIDKSAMLPDNAPVGEKVTISFNVAIPSDGEETKAMGNTPTIDPDGFYVAVFGGSGYFNEWVKATVESATANYDGTGNTMYTLSASFTVSDSRLRLHFIANCPVSVRTSPPISGSSDNEENVISKIRSQRSETYNDGYWQKIILPNGIRAEKALDQNNKEYWAPTQQTVDQFPTPIVLVRNFARVYLRNLTRKVNGQQEVVIKKFALAYAPSEGVIAPILSAPYSSDVIGTPITVADDDETTRVYFESFFMNYQDYPISSTDTTDILITSAPFNYEGYSPADQAYNYYSGNEDAGIPKDSDMQTWNADSTKNVLYVYERSVPNASRRATRLIIKAERFNVSDPNNVTSEGDKYYALDIVNTEGVAIALLRNQTYTIHLLNIEAETGETDINKASEASSATVSGDPNYQSLINISDGKSSIGTSFTEKFYVQPQTDSVMFRYIPTNITDGHYTANQEGNELVTIDVGAYNGDTGVFTSLTTSQASSQEILTFKTAGNDYKVWIVKDNSNKAIPYVRADNKWVQATQAQIDNTDIEKWGMIKYELSESYLEDGYFEEERTMAIHVQGSYDGRDMSRNVVIKTSPRQTLIATCQQKYVPEKAGEQEVIQIKIPAGLSRSVFPLEFTIEADAYSLTPNGDVIPVAYGTSTIEGNDAPAFYFVKTLTQTQYDALPPVTENGKKWIVFDCNFKTTVAQNASRVYVKNKFFTDTQADDIFYNYSQRLFTWSSQPNNVYRHGNVTYTFVMDNAHSGNTVVWWDPTNALNQSSSAEQAREKGLSTSNRVLPPIMTVTLQGFTPQYQADGETPVTTGLEYLSGNTYLYNVGSGAPTSSLATVSLALTATGGVGSTGMVTLSTANLTEIPLLYAPLQSNTVTIQGSSFTNLTFNPIYLPYGLNKTTTFSFTYVDGVVVPITVSLGGLTPNGTDTRLTANGDGTYTFTPTDVNTRTYSLSLKSTTLSDSGTVTLSNDNYETASATITRHRVTGTATFNSSNVSTGTNQSAISGPITASFTRIDGTYNDYLEVNSGNSTTLTITPTSSASMGDVTISDVTISFYRGRSNNYNPNSITGPFTGGTGNNNNTNSLNATYNGTETSSSISTTLTARGNREFDMQVTVSYSYYE